MGKTIDLINKDYENAGRYLEEAQRQLDLLDRDCKEKEHLYNCTQDLAVIDKQIDELRGQCLWAKVHEIGNDIETKRSDAMQYKEQLQDVHAQISKLTMEKEIANKDHEDAKQRLLLERNAINDDVQLRQTLEKSLQAAKKTVARFQSQLAQYEKSEQSAIKRRADLHNQLSGLEAQRSRDRFQEDQERAEQIHKLKLRIMEQSEQVKETQREADQARRELEQCREAVNQKKALLQQKLNNKSDIERELQRLQRAAADQLNRFGRDMPSLIERIRAESGKFRVQPVGPIGAYVNVRDKRYSAAVQHAISKKLLCGFIVDSFADQKSLSQLFQQFYRNPRDIPFILVLKQPTARYDIVPRNPAYGDHPRVVDVIEITDTWCYNAIIDRAHIDSTLLMPNAALAQRLLRDMEQRREMTPTILTPDLDRITLNKGSLNNVSNLGGDRQNSILENVTQADLEELQRNVREAHMQSQSIKAEQTELMKLVEKASDVARLANRKVQAMTSDLDTSKADLANLGKQATFDDDHIGGLILDLHDRIAKCEQLVDDAKADQAACHENLLAAQEEHDRTVRKVEEFNENASRAGSGLEKATDDVNQAMKALAEVQANMNKIGPFQHTLERKLQGFVQELDSLEEQMERVRQEALTQTSGRVLSPESSSTEIMKEVYRMEAKKQADREAISSDSIEQITAAYVKAKEDCETAKMKMAESQRDFNRIEKKLRASSKDWEVFKKRLSKQASYDFQYNMSQKGHEGHIRFDHERGTLQMFVKMQHHQGEADMTSDTKALSGGERSFTTLAFVIAVGESIRTPFRALDEFDIFMDSVNRKIAITLLMDLADKYRNRQFIFITPQDVSMVPTSPTTFVLMLKPPIRPSH